MSIDKLIKLNKAKQTLELTMLSNPSMISALMPALLAIMDVVIKERFKILERCGKNEDLFSKVMKIRV